MNDLKDLLALTDDAFVRSAYLLILGREPDSIGETYYIDRLKLGISRKQVLADLCLSMEAKVFQSNEPLRREIDKFIKWHTLKRSWYKPFFFRAAHEPLVRTISDGKQSAGQVYFSEKHADILTDILSRQTQLLAVVLKNKDESLVVEPSITSVSVQDHKGQYTDLSSHARVHLRRLLRRKI